MEINFIIPGDIYSLTGGYLYNRRLSEGLELRGHKVHLISLPEPLLINESVKNKCSILLRKLPEGSVVLIDSLVLGLLHELIREFRYRLQIIGLIHLPSTFNPLIGNGEKTLAGYELEALTDVHHLIVTGQYLKQLLANAGLNKNKISLVEPGVNNFARKQLYADVPCELLCISNYSAIKGQIVLINALNELRKSKWTLRLYGNLISGKDYVDKMNVIIKQAKLQDRILIYDKLEHSEITIPFLNADLFILPSLFESYGMVLTESLAHGIPVLTTTAGNIPSTVPKSMGIFTEPGNADNLATALNELFNDPGKYKLLCQAAAGYYRQARTWDSAVDDFERILQRLNLF